MVVFGFATTAASTNVDFGAATYGGTAFCQHARALCRHRGGSFIMLCSPTPARVARSMGTNPAHLHLRAHLTGPRSAARQTLCLLRCPTFIRQFVDFGDHCAGFDCAGGFTPIGVISDFGSHRRRGCHSITASATSPMDGWANVQVRIRTTIDNAR